MSMRCTRLLLAGAAVLNPSSGIAQDGDKSVDQVIAERTAAAADQFVTAGQAVMSQGSPNDRASAGFNKPTLQFTTAEDETNVSLAFSLDIDDYAPIETKSDSDFYRVSRTQLSFFASAPIKEAEPTSALFSGDSLISGTRVKLSLSRLSATLGNAREAERWINEAYKNCIAAAGANWLAQHQNADANPAKELAAFQRALGNPLGEHEILLKEMKDRPNATQDGVAVAVYNACVPKSSGAVLGSEGELVDRYTENGPAFENLFHNKGSYLTFLGIDGSVGRDNYKYLERDAFQLTDTARTSWEVGAYAGMINTNLTFSARVRAVYGKTYELAQEAEVCRTFADTLEEQCLTGPDGLPIGKNDGLISLETRHLFAIDETNRIALAPQLTYRFDDETFGVEVPVYLAPDKDGKLSGGIKFAYNSKEEDEFGIGVFVGIPFSILFE